MEPKIIVVTGKRNHCKSIQTYLNLPNLGGRGGRIIIEKIAVVTNPTVARVMIVRVKVGKLKDKTV